MVDTPGDLVGEWIDLSATDGMETDDAEAGDQPAPVVLEVVAVGPGRVEWAEYDPQLLYAFCAPRWIAGHVDTAREAVGCERFDLHVWPTDEAQRLVALTMSQNRVSAAIAGDAADESEELDEAQAALRFGSRISVCWRYQPEGSPMTVGQLARLKRPELQRLCKQAQLVTTGTAAALRSRLEPMAAAAETWTREWFTAHVVGRAEGRGDDDFEVLFDQNRVDTDESRRQVLRLEADLYVKPCTRAGSRKPPGRDAGERCYWTRGAHWDFGAPEDKWRGSEPRRPTLRRRGTAFATAAARRSRRAVDGADAASDTAGGGGLTRARSAPQSAGKAGDARGVAGGLTRRAVSCPTAATPAGGSIGVDGVDNHPTGARGHKRAQQVDAPVSAPTSPPTRGGTRTASTLALGTRRPLLSRTAR